jgi:hypothetical protein
MRAKQIDLSEKWISVIAAGNIPPLTRRAFASYLHRAGSGAAGCVPRDKNAAVRGGDDDGPQAQSVEHRAEQIARVDPILNWWPGCGRPCTDLAVGGYAYSEYFLEQDEALQAQMLRVPLQAEANVNKVVSDASAKMARILKGGG